MELARALKLIVDNKDVDASMFDTAVHDGLNTTMTEARDKLASANPRYVHIGNVHTFPKEVYTDLGTVEWRSEFEISNCTVIILVRVSNSGDNSHEPRIRIKLLDSGKHVLFIRERWFSDLDGWNVYGMILEALQKISKPEPLKFDNVCKADEPPKMEWFYMTFWNDNSLLDIVRSQDYDEIVLKWHRDVNNRRCTPIMNGLWPTEDIEQKARGELSKKVNKDHDFLVLASEFEHWAGSVKIGDQEWTTVNLRLDDGEEGIYVDCYTGETYYTWDAAMRVAGKIPGWHLPTREEWEKLVKFCDVEARKNLSSACAGETLKSTSGWYNGGNGTDSFGFNGKPSGLYSPGDSRVNFGGDYGRFWSATPYGTSGAYSRSLYCSGSYFYESYDDRSDGFSVRLLKDTAQQEGK